MEIPDEVCAHVDQTVVIGIRGNGFIVGTGIAGGNAIGQFFLMQQFHCLDHFLIGAFSPAAVRGGLIALQRDGRNKILDPQHFVGKIFVDQSGIGKTEEHAVIVLFTQADQIFLPHQRFAAGVDVHVNAQFLALPDDAVDFIKGQIQLVPVFCGPAAGAM